MKNLPAMQETRVRPLVGNTRWRKAWQPMPVFLPGESHGQRILEGYSPWFRKESDMTDVMCTAQHSVTQQRFTLTVPD